ncbi:MAG: YfhO family protein [Acidobacteriia bacterium]|nr:YfhO family protein [Terriglobia bacterium]
MPSRSTAKYLALLALAVFLFYWKSLLTRQFTLLVWPEDVNLTYGWLNFWVTSIRHGQVPLWDPYAFSGRPFAGEMLPSAFYPLHLVLALVPFNRDGLFSPQLYSELLIGARLLGAFFAFALLRDLGVTRFAAFVGACCFSLGGLVVRMPWPPYVESAIWLPAILLFLLRALRAERPRAAVLEATLSGACLGMSILAGGLHMSILQAIVVVTAGVYYAAVSRRTLPTPVSTQSHWLRVTLVLAVASVVAAGAGAVQLLPSMEYSRLSLRYIGGDSPVPASQKIPYDRLSNGTWPQSIVAVLFPNGFDGKTGATENWAIPYVGVFPFLLAVIGVWKCWSNLWVRYLAGLAVLAFLYSLGGLFPIHGVLYALVPGLWMARESVRFLYLASFALAVLAAFGLDTLVTLRSDVDWTPALRILKWVAIACCAALVVPGIFTQFSINPFNSLSLLLILGSCAWFVFLTRKPAGGFVRLLLAVFILFDLDAFQWTEANKSQLSKSGDPLQQMLSLRGAMRFVESRPGLYRARLYVDGEPNYADVYQVSSTWGGGGTVLADYLPLVDHDDLLGVRYHIKPVSAADPSPLYADGHWKVYENPAAYPRAWVVHETRVEPSREALLRIVRDSAIDFRRRAVLRSPLPLPLGPAPKVAEPVRFRSYEANRMSMEVTLQSTGLLVLGDVDYPGWRATVNGKPAAIHQVDGALRGIVLGAGGDRITLDYAPVTVYAGGAMSLLTYLWVLSAAALRWRQTAIAQSPLAAFQEMAVGKPAGA